MIFGLTYEALIALAVICFVAGMVRGFSGFALSAVVMAVAVLFLSPVALIPLLWFQEMCASLLMVKGGWQDADRRMAYGLVIGNTLGWPLGLWLTTSLPIETSKLIALSVIITLAVLQLAKVRMAFLATRPGLLGSGVLAGVASGVAHVGGMVVALYVLARNAPARQMRASLVLYLSLSVTISLFIQIAFGVMTWQAVQTGLLLVPATAAGVILGKTLFKPQFEAWYKPFCLGLLIVLALVSLARTILT